MVQVISLKDWMNANTLEEKRGLMNKSDQAKEVMDKFINAYQGQKALEVFKEAMPVDEYWKEWCEYESKMKTAARSIRDGKLEKIACRLYPEFKDVLTTFMIFI